MRVVLSTADEAVAVATGDDAGLRAERRGARVATAVHAGRDLIARRALVQALAKRLFAIRFGEPPVDARARIAKARGVLSPGARSDARACLSDSPEEGRIWREEEQAKVASPVVLARRTRR